MSSRSRVSQAGVQSQLHSHGKSVFEAAEKSMEAGFEISLDATAACSPLSSLKHKAKGHEILSSPSRRQLEHMRHTTGDSTSTSGCGNVYDCFASVYMSCICLHVIMKPIHCLSGRAHLLGQVRGDGMVHPAR